MRPLRTTRAALAFLLSAPGVALAQPPIPPAAPSLAVLAPVAPRFESVRYWRREREPERVEARPKSPIQIHAGFFDPDGNSSNSFAFGLRGGPLVDDHIQIGLGLDWYHEAQNEREVVSRTSQNGVPVAVTRELSSASSDLVPLQAFLQLNMGDGRSLIPYAGVAGGYQVLFLSATDFQTGADYSATFGGWGWQAWGGAALPLSSRARMFGEAFYNWAEVGRDVDDPAAGVTYRELVDANGVGMRFGLSWGY